MLPRLAITADMSKAAAQRDFNASVRDTQKMLSKIDRLAFSLPPYDVSRDSFRNYGEALYQGLNLHSRCGLFEDGRENDAYSIVRKYPDSNEYGYMTYGDDGKETFYLKHFDLTPMLEFLEDKELVGEIVEDIGAVNKSITAVVTPYIYWLEGVLRVKYVYARLVDEFCHIRHGFLDEHEFAEQFKKYLATEKLGGKKYMRLGSAEPQAVKHEVFRPDGDKPILCGSYVFDRIGDFLYTNFFHGLRNNYLPKKCANCGVWFLLPHGKYSDYCENPLADGSGKTCRSVSARKKYDDKCRTDPVWLAYNRAYKAHYARFMKKKMTNSEFET